MAHQSVEEEKVKVLSYLEKNLEVLAKVNRALAEKMRSLPGDGTDPIYTGTIFSIENAKNNILTMKAASGEETVYLHSKYDPIREATDKVRGAFDEKKKNYFVVLGFGLGYTVDEILNECSPNTKIVVIEAHMAAFRLAMEVRDLTHIISDRRIIFAFGNRIEDGLGAFIGTYVLAETTGVGFIEITGRTKLPSGEFYHSFLERLKGVIITSGGNFQTLMTMAWTYQKNTMMSLRKVVDNPPVRMLFDAFEGKPAIIVSAGPSLDKNIHHLKNVKDKAVIIAVDTSLRRLLAEGIEPHLICTGDPQEANWKHLKGTKTDNAYLVAEPMTYFASLEHFEDRLFIASYGDKVMQWVSEHIPDVGKTLCWGSVATMAFDLARKMSCDPIIFIGQDLSFPGGRTYVKGTYFEDEAKQDMSVEAFEKRFKTFTVEDIHGEKVKTNRQMFAYKEWFRTEFARTKSRVINATEGGILRENCELGIFEEVIGECLDETFDTYSTIQEAASRFDGYDLAKLRRALFEIIGSINHSIEICNEGIGIVRDTVNAVENMDTLPEKWCADIIKKLDKLRFELKDEISMKPFIETANQTGVLNFHRGYKKLNNQKFTRVLFSQVLDLYTDLYMSMGRTCRGVLPFFVKGFKSIEDESLGRKSDGVEECLTTN